MSFGCTSHCHRRRRSGILEKKKKEDAYCPESVIILNPFQDRVLLQSKAISDPQRDVGEMVKVEWETNMR